MAFTSTTSKSLRPTTISGRRVHQRVFAAGVDPESNPRKILNEFMRRAWRRPATEAELDKKLALFNAIRPSCDDAQQAMLEVLATVISSQDFLYIVQIPEPEHFDLATRLAMFLWSSVPDEELLKLAEAGRLSDPETLAEQVDRMLADERSARFSHHFVQTMVEWPFWIIRKWKRTCARSHGPGTHRVVCRDASAGFQHPRFPAFGLHHAE